MTPLRLRDRVRKLPAGDFIVHGTIFILGLAFIALGVALSVLPGPFTIPPILVGLLIWSLEFDFAEKWLDKAKEQAQVAWDYAKEHPWRTGIVSGGGIALVVAGAILASKYGLIEKAKDLVV